MRYNIVTNYKINQIFKSKSKYFRVNLGLSATSESKSGDRLYNTNDEFAFHYNNMYRTTVLGQGSIGDIKFYTDHYIKEDKIAFYQEKEEFIFDFDQKIVNEKGIDFYLGHLIKQSEIEFEKRQKEKEEQKEEQKKEVGDANKLIENPGNVKYSDIKAYLEKARLERLKK